MPDVANAATGIGHAAESAAFEILDVIFEWIVPVITLVVGYVLSASLGLSGCLGTVIDGALGATGISATAMVYVADLIAILIWGVIGGGLWAASNKVDGKYAMWIMRPLATLFFGFALGEIGALASGNVLNGSLGKAVNSVVKVG